MHCGNYVAETWHRNEFRDLRSGTQKFVIMLDRRPRRRGRVTALGDVALRVERTLPNHSAAEFSDNRLRRRAGAG